MSTEVQFGELPPRRGRARVSHAIVAAQLREKPGQWALVDRRSTANLAASSAYNIRHAEVKWYEPAGSFESTSRVAVDGESTEYQVWARFVGEGQ